VRYCTLCRLMLPRWRTKPLTIDLIAGQMASHLRHLLAIIFCTRPDVSWPACCPFQTLCVLFVPPAIHLPAAVVVFPCVFFWVLGCLSCCLCTGSVSRVPVRCVYFRWSQTAKKKIYKGASAS